MALAERKCALCPEAHPGASLRCENCALDMCDLGKQLHDRMPALKEHRVVLIAELAGASDLPASSSSSSSSASSSTTSLHLSVCSASSVGVSPSSPAASSVPAFPCPEHKKQIEIFDQTCERLVCADCLTAGHNKHELQQISDAASVYRDQVDGLLAKARALTTQLKQDHQVTSTALQQLSLASTQHKRAIYEAFEEIRAALVLREKALLDELSTRHAQAWSGLTGHCDGLKAQCDRLEQAEKGLAERRDDAAVLSLKSALSLAPALVGVHVPELEVAVDRNTLGLVSQFGSIVETNSACATTSTLTPSAQQNASQPLLFILTCRDRQGQLRAIRRESFHIELQGEVKVEDKHDGTFLISVTVQQDCQLSVRFQGVHVNGSPSQIQLLQVAPFTAMWGTRGNGRGQFAGPYGVAAAAPGAIFIADKYNHRIQAMRADGTFVREWGSKGTGKQQFNCPVGVAFSGTQLFVVERGNNRVQVFRTDGAYVQMIGKSGHGQSEFNCPWAAAVLENYLFVTDCLNHRVQVFHTTGFFVRTWGSQGTKRGQFNSPRGIAAMAGEVFVADQENHRIQVFGTDGTFRRTWGTKGSAKGEFLEPFGLAISPAGALLVADTHNHRVQVFRPSGTFVRMFGSKGIAEGQFREPSAISVVPDGIIIVADSSNDRIQAFRPEFGAQ